MNKVMKRIAPIAAVLGMVVIASCSSVGPLTLNLAPSQAVSGANRTMESAVDLSVGLDTSNVEYKIFGELSTPRVSGFAFSIAARFDSKDWLRNIATALEVPGDVIKQSKNSFTIGFNKDTGAGIWMWIDDAGSWWSYFPGTDVASSSPSSSSCEAGKSCPAVTAEKPKNLLPEDEAIARATRFLLQIGFRLNSFRLNATKSDYSTDVTGNLFIANIPTNLNFSFSYGEDGKVLAASGPLLIVRKANGYYLITPDEGVKRLSDPRYSSIGASTRTALDMATSSPTSSSSNAPLTVPITRVEYSLMQSLLANGTTILLPAYTYFNEDGVVGTVIAMKDEYLIFGDLPVNTDEPTPLNTAGHTSSAGGSSVTRPSVVATPEATKLLVGLSEAEATKVAEGNGWVVRIAMRDGEAFQLTMDFSESRVNFTIVKGIVTAASIG